eukprot:CAMPEP_0195525100 /NCGR_PEP_ID=MMETSP0794_2-20130614/25332_1 /TAXON_ID=515487 /ORGANISM="Stephanopyxis turris, Strain CCMP 815" /LENGTH=202 /DNA_ID=CAMNT_0040655469 /DNA_START=213 /DNA_END=818 /DNA_ORIENTATION=+
MPNKWGRTPLHIACCHSSEDVVRKLIESNIAVASMLEEDGHTPMSLMCWVYRNKIDRVLKVKVPPNQSFSEFLTRVPGLPRIWNIGRLLINVDLHGTVEQSMSDDKLWSAITSSDKQYPSNFLELTKRILEIDEKGNVPISNMSLVSTNTEIDLDILGDSGLSLTTNESQKNKESVPKLVKHYEMGSSEHIPLLWCTQIEVW